MIQERDFGLQEKEELNEKCGVVAWYSYSPDKHFPLALQAASGVQHRGQQGVGIAQKTEHGILVNASNGLIREVFTPFQIDRLNQESQWTLVHTRYGTNGDWEPVNLQPCRALSSQGETIVVIHNGEFVNTAKMRKDVLLAPNGASDTYLFTQLLAEQNGNSWEEKIIKTLQSVDGSYSLIIGIGDELFVARDPRGIKPLFIGENHSGILVASESVGFNKVDVHSPRPIKRGEIIKINQSGIQIIREGKNGPGNFCEFEWHYILRPDSLMPIDGNTSKEEIYIASLRERYGAILAKEHPIKNATFIVGIPDSGVAISTGYANALGIPYRQLILRDHYDEDGSQRTFMRDDELGEIRKKIRNKLSFVEDRSIWKGAIVVFGDDSIVRSNVSGVITQMAWALGAKEIHWVSSYPAIAHTCHLGVSMRTYEQLVAARHNGNAVKIAQEIGATSVRYISHEGMIRARLGDNIKIPEDPREIFLANGGCGGCITGLYPVSKEGVVYQTNGALSHPKGGI